MKAPSSFSLFLGLFIILFTRETKANNDCFLPTVQCPNVSCGGPFPDSSFSVPAPAPWSDYASFNEQWSNFNVVTKLSPFSSGITFVGTSSTTLCSLNFTLALVNAQYRSGVGYFVNSPSGPSDLIFKDLARSNNCNSCITPGATVALGPFLGSDTIVFYLYPDYACCTSNLSSTCVYNSAEIDSQTSQPYLALPVGATL